MNLFHDLVFLPVHNLLVFFVDILPGGDLGLAVIAVTLIVKLVLLPLSLQAARTQRMMRAIEPELKALRERTKDNKEAQAREMLALYKEKNVKPFASILMLFLQIPIIFGLYFVSKEAATTVLDASLLYSFVPLPESVSLAFLGIFSVTTMSITLALVAAATQFVQALYVIPVPEKPKEGATMQEEFAHSMATQARYIFPILIGIFALSSGAIALYFSAASIFMVAQEALVRKLHPNEVRPA